MSLNIIIIPQYLEQGEQVYYDFNSRSLTKTKGEILVRALL